MVRFFVLFLIIFCITTNNAISVNVEVIHEKLDNGMEIYILPNNRSPAVMHMVLYKVGGSDDPVGYSGLAHFFEHLMFSGTEKFPNLISTLSSIGAQFNAGTSASFTMYHELVPKQYLPLVMDIESDRMKNLKITDNAFTREQKVVLEERKMRTESKASTILEEEMENAFYYNGYSRPVVGWEHEINQYNKKIAEAFYKSHYSPNNAILLVAGDVDSNEVIKLAKQYYGKIEPSTQEFPRVPRLEPQHKVNMTITLEDESVEVPELFLMNQIPSKLTKNYITNMITAEILGNGRFSMLYNDLVLNNPIVTSISTGYNHLVYSDTFLSIHAVPKDGITIQTVEEEIYKCINDYIENGIPEEYLEAAKYRTKATMTYAFDGLDFISQFYGISLVIGIPLSEINNMFNLIDNITIDDVNSTLQNIFQNKAKFAGHLLPKSGA
ncbi:Hypothetical zinc protease [Ehrlichia ruminantium str. Gardel]|uniref:M16 family metallopeptidase n=1 Tax=Ehrlichia ruminantium TaxID=779 RepID=UPI00004C7942|nr:pitrilysin family protein [Ehrlichia ruminantium]CAI28299.1 Hypothetical zinc protease [Ehrlichia ruminantium str. Gardel]